MNYFKNAYGHFKTITRHRHQVIKHCKKAGILWQGLFHDLSKYTPSEFLSGVKYFSDGKKSPNEKERELLGYSKAWLHHKGRNKHHFEYWTDYSKTAGKVVPIDMPNRYLKELICDRIAASKIYQGSAYTDSHPLNYFNRAVGVRFISEKTSLMIQKYLTILAEEGEDVLFKKLRALK